MIDGLSVRESDDAFVSLDKERQASDLRFDQLRCVLELTVEPRFSKGEDNSSSLAVGLDLSGSFDAIETGENNIKRHAILRAYWGSWPG